MVIFGAGGDLTRPKLLPALYNLATANLAQGGSCSRILRPVSYRLADWVKDCLRVAISGERLQDWSSHDVALQ